MNNQDLPTKKLRLAAYDKTFGGRIPVRFKVDEKSIESNISRYATRSLKLKLSEID